MRLLFSLLLVFSLNANADTPDLVLRGALTGADHQTYRSVPFEVPAGVERITVEFDYNGKEERSVIDLGLLGPDGRLRGWSGGNKRAFTVSGVDATPSYQPTPTTTGTWALLLGIPNMRQHGRAEYTAQVYFSRSLNVADEPSLLRPVLRNGAGWYRGDLHTHTGHSDGSCPTTNGAAPVPCPLYMTAVTAQERKLDFVAITEHNYVGHANAMREMQPRFDELLLMPAREITTFYGHANLFGTLAPLDFRIAPGAHADANSLLAAAAELNGLLSINHPVRPSGEQCMGCGWEQATDMRRVQAIEVVNGPDADSEWSGIPFWHAQLQRGLRITAIGGSDNHRPHEAPGTPGALGEPTTVVHARELSQLAVLDAIRAGHVFIDLKNVPGRVLDLSATAAGQRAMMGDALVVKKGDVARFSLRVARAKGARIELLFDGEPASLLGRRAVDADEVVRAFSWPSDGKRHWLRVDVRDAAGKLILLGNPIYLNPEGS
ncbi:CehA/McbA family metallohydrolase [Massilia sp. HP4]|uniref:CehA/McbA family metallohydrolase n=1 Tax=Massilia sp. HP4 TaxID=2562316 RepID=UPI0010BFBF76|nr:CehA/McbA family metallohydrolase [Massilia sp. HP4]